MTTVPPGVILKTAFRIATAALVVDFTCLYFEGEEI
jgi:hypothetical protein